MLYDRPVRVLLQVAVSDMPSQFKPTDVVDWFKHNYPLVKESTVRAHLVAATVNDPTRVHYNPHQQLVYRRGRGLYERYDRWRHGEWRGDGSPASPTAPEPMRETEEVLDPPRRRQSGPASRVSRHQHVLDRADELAAHVDQALQVFREEAPFSGPSIYFHQKTMELLGAFGDPATALQDDAFIDSIYATLVAWGMHRLGSGGSKLVDRRDFARALHEQAPRLSELHGLTLWSVVHADVADVASELWSVMNCLEVSATESKLVAASKTLAHVLPELVPPIDRSYTATFFYGTSGKTLHMGQETAFMELFGSLHRVANGAEVRLRAELDRPDGYMNTSIGKVVDNAVVGAILLERRGRLSP